MSEQRFPGEPWELIATLEPFNPLTRLQFKHPFNGPIWPLTVDPTDYTDRAETPLTEAETTTDPLLLDESALVISFSRPPRDPVVGYVLGSSPDHCDAIIGLRKDGVSGRHLILRFDSQKRLIITDVSRNGTEVSYNRQAYIQRRKGFRWVLPADYGIMVGINNRRICFTIRVVNHPSDNSDHFSRYMDRVGAFMRAASNNLPVEDNFIAHSSTAITPHTASHADRIRQPGYVLGSGINAGEFGAVRVVYDVSTWQTFAGKQVKEATKFRKEVGTLKRLSHENIVNYIDVYCSGHIQLLIMEYCDAGSLEDFTSRWKLTSLELATLLHQGLVALRYLHEQKVVHRDIKPANILIKQWAPPIFALADFGLANASGDAYLRTFCGTSKYLAPDLLLDLAEGEIRQYDDRVDIWSLGVVILELAQGLKATSNSQRRNDLLKYTQTISTQANDLLDENPNNKLCLILYQMLQFNPKDRSRAADCVQLADSILSDERLKAENAVPTQE